MTKKEFKEKCRFDLYSGVGYNRTKTNAIFFDWQETEQGRGFKFGVAANRTNCSKADLFKHLYDWVEKEISLPYYVRYKLAETDAQRFKTPISLNF
jgi:hypothetical protein